MRAQSDSDTAAEPQRWYTQSVAEVLKALHSRERGLSTDEAARRLQTYGPNKLPETKADSAAVIFLRQFQSPLIYILFAASAAVFALGEVVDAAIILFVLFFNAVVGSVQEGRAQNTLRALKKFVETSAAALRDGKEVIISDSRIIPGDIVLLLEGDKVPADGRIIVADNLKVDESSLSGESEPVHKTADRFARGDVPTAGQKNMVFKGTHLVAGSGKAVVTATGTHTLIGSIAKNIAAFDTEIPLKANIRALSRIIVVAGASISVAVFLLGLALGVPLREIFAVAISLAVSIIPEGLPIVVTLILAAGVWRMSKRNALVKRLQAVEALGQASVIAVDKTGTITKNEQMVERLYVNRTFFEVGGAGYEPKGDLRLGDTIIDPLGHPELLFAGKIAALCVAAHAAFDAAQKRWVVFGDPTEAALAVCAGKIGFRKDNLERESPKIAELPFNYKTKYRAAAHQTGDTVLLSVVGAPEAVLQRSSTEWRGGARAPLQTEDRDALESVSAALSSTGLRVVALAFKETAHSFAGSDDVGELTFVGFAGLKDTLRPGVHEALRQATAAGIRVVMITGDHALTAQSIAREAGMYRPEDSTLTGADIDALSDSALAKKVAHVSVFARVTPEHKLRIVSALRAHREVVAVTGDGVNDAPSLVAADLGVAMGKIGTEVAKESADIILLDDNFGTIVAAVEEGRTIYRTIRKVILYLFSTSVGEVLTIVGALFLGYPIPLLAAQIIWLNFVTDGFLTVALGMEPKEEGILRGRFARPKKYLIDAPLARRMALMALPMAVGTLFLFREYLGGDMAKAWTISLTTLAVFQWFNAWNCRHESKSIFTANPFSNPFLVAATAIIIILQLLAIYHPLLQNILRTTGLSLIDWVFIVPVAASIVLVEEIRKLLYRRKTITRAS